MKRYFLFSKIHQARVTHADLNYEGSFSIDKEILTAAGILENEKIDVYNIDNGARFSTYAIAAAYGSRIMGANGACARRVQTGDRVIICTFAEMENHEWLTFVPTIVLLDRENNFKVKPNHKNMECEKLTLESAF